MKSKRTSLSLILVASFLSLAILSCEGLSNLPNPFATATLTPTSTSTATPTPSPTPTATITPTPIPTGIKMEEQPDTSTVFTDYDNQFEVTLPKGWVVIPLTGKDIAKIIADLAKQNPDLAGIAKTFQNLDGNVIRAVAIPKDSKYIVSGFATNITIVAIDSKLLASLPMQLAVTSLEDSLKQQNAKLISGGDKVINNSHGVEVGLIDYLQTTPTSTSSRVQVRTRNIMFVANNKMILISVVTPKQFGDELLPVVNDLIDAVKVPGP